MRELGIKLEQACSKTPIEQASALELESPLCEVGVEEGLVLVPSVQWYMHGVFYSAFNLLQRR